MKKWLFLWIVVAIALWIMAIVSACHAETGIASYFSNIETGGKNCADNKYHDLDTELVVASWRYPLNSCVRISNRDGNSILCRVVDRGPGRKDGTSKYYKGRRIADLSKKVFEILSPSGSCKEGLISVKVERI